MKTFKTRKTTQGGHPKTSGVAGNKIKPRDILVAFLILAVCFCFLGGSPPEDTDDDASPYGDYETKCMDANNFVGYDFDIYSLSDTLDMLAKFEEHGVENPRGFAGEAEDGFAEVMIFQWIGADNAGKDLSFSCFFQVNDGEAHILEIDAGSDIVYGNDAWTTHYD